MTALHIKAMRGMVPRTSERLLQGNYATEALNCKLTSGRVDPLRGPSLVHTSLAAAIATIYRYRFGGQDNWMVWSRDVDVVRSPTAQDAHGRVYYTGDGEPRMTTFDAAINGSGPYPDACFVLGVYVPTVAPTVAHTGGAASNETRSYAFSFVTPLDEEGPLSPETVYSAPTDATSWDLSNLEAPPPNSGTITGAVTISLGVVEVELNTVRGLAVHEEITFAGVTGMTDLNGTFTIDALDVATNKIRVALDTAQTYSAGADTWTRVAPHNTTGMTRRIYRSVGTNTDYKLVAEQDAALTTFTDNVASTALGSQPTVALDSYTPPKNGHSICELANGSHAMLAGNEICISEQYKPYSYPLANRYAFAGTGVAAVAAGNSVIVLTDGIPVVFTATVPGAASPSYLEDCPAPCVSKAGVVDTGGACLSPSHDGLWFFTPAGGKKITQATYRLDEWAALKPDTFNAAFYDGCYYAMHDAADGDQLGRIWKLDLSQPDSVSEIDERVDALYANPLDGKLYVGQGNRLYQWDAEDSQRFLSYWRSADFQLGPPLNFKVAQVHARYDEIVPVDHTIEEANEALLADADSIEHAMGITEIGAYAIGVTNVQDVPQVNANRLQFSLLRAGTIVFTKELSSSRSFKLPAGFKAEVFAVQIASSIPWFSVSLAEDSKELAAVST